MRISARQSREGEPTIDDMRRDLAEAATDTLLDNASDITELLLDGFVGLNETPDIEIKDEWNQLFGEST